MSSSPGWVELASQTGLPAVRPRSRSSSALSKGSGPPNDLRLRPARAPGAPSCARSAAVRSSWQWIRRNLPSRCRAEAGSRRHRPAERTEMRAFTSASGMPASAAMQISCGHSSLSTKVAESGRQCARKRLRIRPESSGASWCRVRGGSRSATIRADAAVPEVIRKARCGCISPSCSISRSTDSDSPTEAAWNHASGPGGLGAVACPARSRTRSGAIP